MSQRLAPSNRFVVAGAFQSQALTSGIGLRLAKCLASKDDDVKYWALSVAHEFVNHPIWRHQFIESGAFAQVLNIGLSTVSRKPLKAASEILPAKDYIMDILVIMWGSSKYLNLRLMVGIRLPLIMPS
jgi:hypothetical protein